MLIDIHADDDESGFYSHLQQTISKLHNFNTIIASIDCIRLQCNHKTKIRANENVVGWLTLCCVDGQ